MDWTRPVFTSKAVNNNSFNVKQHRIPSNLSTDRALISFYPVGQQQYLVTYLKKPFLRE